MIRMLTASIVLYNTPRSQVDAVMKSVEESGCVETLYVIDNSPNDRWRILERQYPAIRYIHSENLGYGADVLPSFVRFMDANPGAAYVLPRVVSPDGEVQRLCKLLPTPFDLILQFSIS